MFYWFMRRGVFLTSLIEGGAQERGRRAGTENIPAIMGMAAALEEACGRIDSTSARVSALRDRLIAGLLAIPHAALNGDAVHRLPGNVNFCFEGIEGESLLLLLDDRGVYASSGSLDPSHVLLAIGRPHEIAHGSLRLTLSEDTTEEEVDYTIGAVREVVAQLRGMSPVWRDMENGGPNHSCWSEVNMALYSEKVMDHFRNPRNVGVIEDADGVGEVGNAKCGDIMKIYLKIEQDVITDVRFETFGCGSAIASSSMATELIKGKPVSEAMALTNKAVAEALNGLPPHKLHCSVLAEEAIKKALQDYYERNGIAYDRSAFPDCEHCGHCSAE